MELSLAARRQRVMHTRPATVLLAAVIVAVLAACGGTGTGGGGTGTGGGTEPGQTPGGSPSPISAPGSEVRSAEEAAAAVAALNPLFDGISQLDRDLIGQGDFWEAVPRDSESPPASWTVTFQIGWGDCQAGCINRHTWTYQVLRDGTVIFESEQGSPLEGGIVAQRLAAAAGTGVGGRVIAGPVCPVEQPGDPACAPRPVAGATLVVRIAGGNEAARYETDASGLFLIELPPGDYTLEAQPVEGLMGTPGSLPFTVLAGARTALDVPYDTGIR